MKKQTTVACVMALALVPMWVPAQEAAINRAGAVVSHDARIEWWHQAKFGMFIHWGLYAILARGEWVMNREKIPVAEYAKLAERFNPVKFNADDWVRVAKEAGMKYIVITSKHHDGFAMYGSKVSPYNIVDAPPFQRDPMKELAAACAKHGIRLGFYYSEAQDWHHPGGAISGGAWDPAQKGDFDEYLHTLAIPQIKELLSGYDPAIMWFDTPRNMTPAYAREIVQVVRSIRPETLVNSRLLYSGRQIPGLSQAQLDELRDIGVDYLSYGDRQISDRPAPSWRRDWETCMTLNNSWGYNANDHNWKSPETVVRMLVQVVSKGGNFLLNFGPTADGELPAEGVKVVQRVGAWLRVNGEAIYGAYPSPFEVSSDEKPVAQPRNARARRARRNPPAQPEIAWMATSRPSSTETGQPAKIYLHIFQWPHGRLEVKGLPADVRKAYLLSDPKHAPLTLTQREGTFSVDLPASPPDPIATVVCLECAGGN